MITLRLQARPVADGLPDADTDVLIFDGLEREGQLGAYVGHDDDGPIWVDAQGEGVAGVTHWAAVPALVADDTPELLQRARAQRDVLHDQLQEVLPLLKRLQDEPTEDPHPLHHLVRDVTNALVAVSNQRLREFKATI